MQLLHSLVFASLMATATIIGATTVNAQGRSERVCKEVCSGGVCSQQCVETEGRGRRGDPDVVIEDRRHDRRDGPGIDLRVPVPVPDIRVGPAR